MNIFIVPHPEMNPVHSLPSCFSKIRLNVIPSFMPRYEQACLEITLDTCILEVLDSNPGRDTAYPD
jgi:hypothetical protein